MRFNTRQLHAPKQQQQQHVCNHYVWHKDTTKGDSSRTGTKTDEIRTVASENLKGGGGSLRRCKFIMSVFCCGLAMRWLISQQSGLEITMSVGQQH